jgi:peptidoglycan hydrolase CwlO-like protein
MDELHDDIDMLNSKNDTLERKISMLERDLRERNMECKPLKDQLRQIDGNVLGDNESFKSNDAATHSTYSSNKPQPYLECRVDLWIVSRQQAGQKFEY